MWEVKQERPGRDPASFISMPGGKGGGCLEDGWAQAWGRGRGWGTGTGCLVSESGGGGGGGGTQGRGPGSGRGQRAEASRRERSPTWCLQCSEVFSLRFSHDPPQPNTKAPASELHRLFSLPSFCFRRRHLRVAGP